jgi:hypothetical protein
MQRSSDFLPLNSGLDKAACSRLINSADEFVIERLRANDVDKYSTDADGDDDTPCDEDTRGNKDDDDADEPIYSGRSWRLRH